MRQIRVAILGQGRSGRDIHGKHLVKVPEQYKIVAVVDPLEDRRNRARQEYSCEAYDHFNCLFQRKDLDLIVNTTPSHLHVPITLEFFNKGFNVLCEKPLARKTGEVDMLIDAAEKSGKVFAVFQQSRYAPYYRQAKKICDSGVLGRIIQIGINFNNFARRWDWQCIQEFNGGNLLNTGPHPVDQALTFLNTADMPQVTCAMDRVNTFGDAEDYVKLILRSPGRPVIDLEISSCCAYPGFTYHIQAQYGGLKGTMEHMDWKYYKPEEAQARQLIKTPLTRQDGTPAYCAEQLVWHEESWDVSEEQKNLFGFITQEYYNMLYKTLTEGAPLEVTPQQVRQQIAVMEECHRQNPLSRI